MGDEITAVAGEVMPSEGNMMGVIERATVDMQIATAHQYPRSMATFKKRAMDMVTLDEETAQSCIYRRPVGKKYNSTTGKQEQEYAEGKSIRMAEIVGACYGNLRVGAMIVEMTPRFVKARGVAHDLESNFAASCEVVESTVTKDGQPYSERMRVVVAKACLAKARRDATFQVVPGALCKSLEEAARLTAIGTEATLGKRRGLVVDWINKAGIEAGRVWNALGINGIEDVGISELETLTGLRTAIKDGDTTIDEAFPDKGNEEKAVAKAKGIVDKIKDIKTPEKKDVEPKQAEESKPEEGTGESVEKKVEEPKADEPGLASISGKIEQISVKDGEKNGKPWHKVSVMLQGEWHTTFSETDGDELRIAEEAEREIEIKYVVNAKGYRDIKAVEVLPF